jgi:hypothetical protein
MWRPTRRLLDVVSNATVGTAIVLVHIMLTESRSGGKRPAMSRRSSDVLVSRE